MKREVFKEKERVFFICPNCGEKCNISACGMIAYEEMKYKCSACKTTFSLYLNQMGNAFTEENNCIRFLGYTYKVL